MVVGVGEYADICGRCWFRSSIVVHNGIARREMRWLDNFFGA